MKRIIPFLALMAAGVATSFAVASPQRGSQTSTSPSAHGSGSQCRPVNLRGTVAGGSLSMTVTKGAGPRAGQLMGAQTLKVDGKVAVQAWACSSGGSSSGPQLFLRQLHVGGKPSTGTTGG